MHVRSTPIYFSIQATGAGPKEPEAVNWLEKKVGELGNLSEAGTIEMAIMALQSVLSTDFRGTEIEVGVVAGDGFFRTLTLDEVDTHLTAITERDA